jgi:serine/threonine protein kinase
MDDFVETPATQASAPDSTRASARTIGRYVVLGEIGRGGMATVYKARQRDLDRLVAIKELGALHAASADFSRRFLRESRLAGALSHPNIVTVYEYFQDSGTPYIAMEYVPRGSLRPWVGRLTLPQLAGVFEGILAGLTHAESSGIVHRDIKPENIMVTGDGRVKITDFGIAKATQGASTQAFATATGMLIGTPQYMAPEQVMGEEIGPWTDLYAVGVIAHEQIVGQAPFVDAKAPMVLLMRHVNERIPSVTELKPGVDGALSDWVDRLLAKDPVQRTANAAAAWEELEEIILKLAGPRWRRDARLPEQQLTFGGGAPLTPAPESAPLTPAPFESRRAQTPASTVKRTAQISPRQPLGRGLRVLAASAAVVAAIGGFLAASNGGGKSAQSRSSLTGSASTRSLTVGLPANWQQVINIPKVPALELHSPLAVAAPSTGSQLVIGTASARAPGLLPDSLLAALGSSPHGEAVKLGSLEAYRYKNLKPRGSSGFQTDYVFTTTAGTMLGACVLPLHGAGAAGADCERILESLKLASGRNLPLWPSQSYAGAVSRAMSHLNATSSALGSRLQSARTPSEQATAAGELARSYDLAATEVQGLAAAPAINDTVAASLRQIGQSYTRMASAARSGDRAAFENARAGVRTGLASLQGAFAQLRTLGYGTAA